MDSIIPTVKPFNYTEASVFTLLQQYRYPPGSCALLPQVANTTGSGATRTADAIAMQLWPSRGLSIEGIEIKVSRTDWMKELAQPQKADAIFQFCDKWYICAPEGVVDLKKDEFPKTWGLLEVRQLKDHLVEPDGKDERGYVKLRTVQEPVFKITEKVKAPDLEAPEPPTRGFLASLLRNLQRHESHAAEQERLVKEAHQRGWDSAEQHYKYEREREKKSTNDLMRMAQDFERETGLEVFGDAWRRDEKLKGIRRRLDLLQKLEDDATYAENLLCMIKERAKDIDRTVDELKPYTAAERQGGVPFKRSET